MNNKEANIYVLQKNVEEKIKKPENKKDILMFQYKYLLQYTAQYGIYLVPQLEDFLIWHGVVFARNGFYKDGKFKFTCDLSDFQTKPPKIIFQTKVYHPLVRLEDGQLDIKRLLDNKWNYGNELGLRHVFQKIRSIFTDVKKFDQPNSYNHQAYQLYKSNIEQFYREVKQCVQNSKQSLYNNYEKTSLRFTETNAQHTKIAQELSNISGKNNLTLQQKKKQFLKYLLQ